MKMKMKKQFKYLKKDVKPRFLNDPEGRMLNDLDRYEAIIDSYFNGDGILKEERVITSLAQNLFTHRSNYSYLSKNVIPQIKYVDFSKLGILLEFKRVGEKASTILRLGMIKLCNFKIKYDPKIKNEN